MVYLNVNANRNTSYFCFEPTTIDDPLHFYGTEAKKVEAMDLNGTITFLKVIYYKTKFVGRLNEMAITLEDVLARRTRCLFRCL